MSEAGDYDMQRGACDTGCVARTAALPTGERCVNEIDENNACHSTLAPVKLLIYG